jgi:3-oxoadipate enol-lactonase
MAFLELPSHRMHYRVDGAGDGAPWLLLCNSLGTDLHMWDRQVDVLSRHFRVLRYDRRGHGRSTAAPPPYSLADLSGDAVALLDALRIERAHFCGLSIGGLTGQWLGINAGHRLDRLVVCASAAKIGTAESWSSRTEAVKDQGLAALTAATAERWFTPAFNAGHADEVADILRTFAAVDPDGYIGCCAALAGADLRGQIGRIANPLLAISGDDDAVCPPADLQFIADGVQRGRHVSLPGRHIVNVESAAAFKAVLLEFLHA